MGSPIWMAPEQADRSPVTPATDVWALGLIAFFLLCGRSFWRSANDAEATIPQVLREVLFSPMLVASERATELGATLPPAFDEWFTRCAAREPAARFPDAAQAGAALVAALAGAAPGPGKVLPFAPTAMADGASLSGSAPGSAAWSAASVPSSPKARGGVAAGGASPAPVAALSASSGGTDVAGSYTVGGAQPAVGSPAVARGLSGRAVTGGAVALVVLGAVLAGGGYWMARRSLSQSGMSAAALAAPGASGDGSEAVVEALRLCGAGRCDGAHKLLAILPPVVRAHHAAEVTQVERAWAADALMRADHAAEPAVKKAILDEILRCPDVDDASRGIARDRLADLDAGEAVAPLPSAPAIPPGMPSSAVPASPAPSGSPPVSPSGGPTAPSPAPVPRPQSTVLPVAPAAAGILRTPASSQSLYDLATSSSPADWSTARHFLEPKVNAGTASIDEIRLLDMICHNQHDASCQKLAKRAQSGKH
jgi:serine/threonine protein kinase